MKTGIRKHKKDDQIWPKRYWVWLSLYHNLDRKGRNCHLLLGENWSGDSRLKFCKRSEINENLLRSRRLDLSRPSLTGFKLIKERAISGNSGETRSSSNEVCSAIRLHCYHYDDNMNTYYSFDSLEIQTLTHANLTQLNTPEYILKEYIFYKLSV